MTISNFHRFGDQKYAFDVKLPDAKEKHIIMNSKALNPSEAYKIIHAISKVLLSKSQLLQKDQVYFAYKDKCYKITVPSKSLVKSVVPSILKYFKYIQNPNEKEYELQIVSKTKHKAVRIDKIEEAAPGNVLEARPISLGKGPILDPLFSDGYTQLAALAFQKYETHYDQPDKPLESTCAIIQRAGKVELIPKEKISDLSPRQISDTVKNYRQFLVKMYGKHKIAYIEHCYGISLGAMADRHEPLTPDIVYKFNMGVGNLENQDIEQLYHNLRVVAAAALQERKGVTFTSFLERHGQKLSFFQVNRLVAALTQIHGEPSVDNLIKFLGQFDFSIPLKRLEPHQFDRLVNLMSVSNEEREQQFTGRKIDYAIQSHYTTAGAEVFKPWVDQQELLQVFPSMQTGSRENFFEKLTYVVCRKHLVRRHPEEGYRIGALIPAQCREDGVNQWYKVTSFVNNGRGIVSYTLDPACHNPALPSIKLYRNTATGAYTLDAGASVRNDLNPLNPPGYEGAYLSENYEVEYFNRSTIPVWVAYQHQAEGEISALKQKPELINSNTLKSIYGKLQSAHQELQQTHLSKQDNSLNLPYLIQRYDAEMIDFLKCVVANKDKIGRNNVNKLINMVQKYRHKEADLNEQRKDARYIYNLLGKPWIPKNRQFERLSKELQMQLGDHPEKLEVKPLGSIDVLNPQNKWHAFAKLQQWNQALAKHAQDLHEDIDSKEAKSFAFAGQSLGSSCAARGLVHFMVKQRRMPLPGHSLSLFSFADPGSRASDNVAFKDFGNKHARLMKEQGVKISIMRRDTVGDFIICGGDEHLGATFSEEERDKVEQWLAFDAAITAELPEAIDPGVAQSHSAHATQVGTARRAKIFMAEALVRHLKKGDLPPEKIQEIHEVLERSKGDYQRTWYTTKEQGELDLGIKSKHWDKLNQVWKLPASTTFMRKTFQKGKIELRLKYSPKFTPVVAIAKLLSFIGESMFNKQPGEEDDQSLHGPWWKYRDENGVFAVDETGVLSKKDNMTIALEIPKFTPPEAIKADTKMLKHLTPISKAENWKGRLANAGKAIGRKYNQVIEFFKTGEWSIKQQVCVKLLRNFEQINELSNAWNKTIAKEIVSLSTRQEKLDLINHDLKMRKEYLIRLQTMDSIINKMPTKSREVTDLSFTVRAIILKTKNIIEKEEKLFKIHSKA